jgi:hypothetical protein
MSTDEKQQLWKQWLDWRDGLAAQGKLSSGYPLKNEGRVISGPRGTRLLDGPFAEGKELIGGFFFLTVSGIDEAEAIARRCPSLPYGMLVEVRPVAELCPVLNTSKQEPITSLASTH